MSVGTKDFRDVTDQLLYGSPSVESKVEDNPAAPTPGSPVVESRPEADKPAEDPAPKEETEQKPPAEKPEAAAEASKQTEVDEDPEIDLGDLKLRRSELKARLKKLEEEEAAAEQDRLRHSDYTKKTQELSKLREQTTAERNAERELVTKITADPDLKEMVRKYPEVLPHLLAEPEATRALLGNPKAIDTFWKDYEVLQENPSLAERLAAAKSQSDPTETEEATRALEEKKTANHLRWIASNLERAVDTVAKEFPGIPKEQVAEYVAGLGGISKDADAKATIDGFFRLHNLFFVKTDQGIQIDTKLIRDRFEFLSAGEKSKAEREAKDAEQHNATVDAELQREATPAAKTASGSPAATAERKSFGNLAEVMEQLRGH
jgi:hypothetical protein